MLSIRWFISSVWLITNSGGFSFPFKKFLTSGNWSYPWSWALSTISTSALQTFRSPDQVIFTQIGKPLENTCIFHSLSSILECICYSTLDVYRHMRYRHPEVYESEKQAGTGESEPQMSGDAMPAEEKGQSASRPFVCTECGEARVTLNDLCKHFGSSCILTYFLCISILLLISIFSWLSRSLAISFASPPRTDMGGVGVSPNSMTQWKPRRSSHFGMVRVRKGWVRYWSRW